MTENTNPGNEGDNFVRKGFLIYFISIVITTAIIGIDIRFLSVMIAMVVIPYIFIKLCIWISELNLKKDGETS